jgi:hypothetical protein
MTTRPLPPQLTELQAVIPVEQTQTLSNWAITCLALERYAEGCKLRFRIFRSNVWPCNPDMQLTVTDDRGTQYRPWMGGGNGMPDLQNCDFRVAYNINPPLDPQARTLHISITEVHDLKYDQAQQRPVVAETYPGPWNFTITITPPPA